VLDSYTVECASCDRRILEIASRIKAHPETSLADSWIGATAIAHRATLVHKDPEFETFKEISQEVLK
jgi:predicted nucleic acid-binding protein